MGKREGGIQERRDVCIHIADSQQKLTQQCKATIPQSKKKKAFIWDRAIRKSLKKLLGGMMMKKS